MTKRIELVCKYGAQIQSGHYYRRPFSPAERFQRATKIGGALWIVAFLTIFIPILHFILPPIFLILGLVFGFATWIDKAEIEKGEYTCAQCTQNVSLERESENFPRELRCPKCQMTILLEADPRGWSR